MCNFDLSLNSRYTIIPLKMTQKNYFHCKILRFSVEIRAELASTPTGFPSYEVDFGEF